MNKLMMMAALALGGQQATAQESGTSSWDYGTHQYTMRGNLTAEQYDQSATGVVTFTNVRQTTTSLRSSTPSSLARRLMALLL